MNPKEHLWSRIKALELFENANIFLMVFNADDRDSYEKVQIIQNDFKECNKVGAYQVLVSVITQDIKLKRVPKAVKKQEVADYIDSKGIPSYLEVRLENGHNIDVLDKHLRFIMNPPANFEMTDADQEYLYKPLFEVITLGKKKIKKMKKKKTGDQWVNRLYYNKPDYSLF